MRHKKYTNRSIEHKKSPKNVVYILIILVIVGVVGFLGYRHYNNKKSNVISYSPPTQEEKSSGDEIKKEVVKKQEQEDSQKKDNPEQPYGQQPTNSSNATVVITDAGQYDDVIEVRAFVSDRYQEGTCKITITKDSLYVSKTTQAYKDARTTICTNPLFDRSEFKQAGEWLVVVEYSSQNYSGKSNPLSIKIK